MNIYDRIKEKREVLGLTQEDLAKKMGYKSRSTIAKIESGENDIPQSKIKAFADALNTTPSYLMGWETVTFPDAPPYDDEITTLINDYNSNPKLKELINAARNAQDDSIELATQMLLRMGK